ncbi:hypothetical protein GBAR_LOCUS30265 [Geodia barretti]|uniref:Uncharacterized protein n=1 Tax=Geodia barretti TaxID=519541 RepID=A0AA35TVU6_GEOBA|nr:hypothetical protein GBAR_LOCUS30265 [Geodia barretti]
MEPRMQDSGEWRLSGGKTRRKSVHPLRKLSVTTKGVVICRAHCNPTLLVLLAVELPRLYILVICRAHCNPTLLVLLAVELECRNILLS